MGEKQGLFEHPANHYVSARDILESCMPKASQSFFNSLLELAPMYKNIMSGYFLIKQGQGRSLAMVWWIESTDRDALLFFHSLFQSLKTLLSGLLNEGHVFSEMLLSVDFPFLTPLQLVQSEL
jgi:hypothetical protein